MSTRKRNDLINFIADAAVDPDLAKRFLRRKTALGIYRFFQKEGYKDILLSECEDIKKAKENVEGLRYLERDDKIKWPWCPPRTDFSY